MAYPAIGLFGTAATWDTELTGDVSYPSTVNNNDIAFLLIHVRDPDAGATLVLDENGTSNWEPMGDQVVETRSGGTYISRLFWRRCDGSESSDTQSIVIGTNAALGPHMARIWTVTGAITSGTPYEGYLTNQGVTTTGGATPTDTITTNQDESLGIAVFCYGDDHSSTADADWTNAGSDTTTLGNDASYYVDYRQIATASTEAASERTYASSGESYVTFSFAVIPVAAGSTPPTPIATLPRLIVRH